MSGFTCSFCLLRFPGQDEMRLHVRSPEHEQKVRESNLDSFIQGPKKTPTNMNFTCEPCTKKFVGRIPYDQHLASEKHLKKIRSLELGGTGHPAQDENQLTCEPCGKKFAGQVPYGQHIISEKHLKKMREAASASPLGSQSPNAVMHNCQICNVSLGSSLEFLDHTNSQEHRIRSLQANDKSGSLTKPTPEEKADRDLLISIIANHKRDFLVCPADVPFMDFVVKHKIFS